MKRRISLRLALAIAITATIAAKPISTDQQGQLPTTPLKFGAFAAQFNADGTFKLNGTGWPAMGGNWKQTGDEIEVITSNAPKGCEGAGRYRVQRTGAHVGFVVIADDCVPRRMILNGSDWSPAEETKVIAARRITHKALALPPVKPESSNANANWPSFRGAMAAGIAEKQNLPDKWDGKTGENIRWRTVIPGLAHYSPVVWGTRIFLTQAADPSFNSGWSSSLHAPVAARSAFRCWRRWISLRATSVRNALRPRLPTSLSMSATN